MNPRRLWVVFQTRALIALGVVFAIVVAMLVLVIVVVGSKLDSATHVDLTLSELPSGGGANYLLIGSDTRSFVTDAADAEAFGDSGDASGQRSDTVMVLHFDPDASRSLLVSFPRDLWVDIPGTGESKLNAAFNDGPQSVIDTLESNFSVPIQHYVEVNFSSFRDLVDAVGTVPVLFPAPARDDLSGLDVPTAGCVEADGPTALALVRSRHLELFDNNTGRWENADAIPDLGRIGRQQAFLRVLGQRAMDRALTNPFAANDIIDQAVGNLTLDSDFGRTDAFQLAAAFTGTGDGASGPESQVPPTPGCGYSTRPTSVVSPARHAPTWSRTGSRTEGPATRRIRSRPPRFASAVVPTTRRRSSRRSSTGPWISSRTTRSRASMWSCTWVRGSNGSRKRRLLRREALPRS